MDCELDHASRFAASNPAQRGCRSLRCPHGRVVLEPTRWYLGNESEHFQRTELARVVSGSHYPFNRCISSSASCTQVVNRRNHLVHVDVEHAFLDHAVRVTSSGSVFTDKEVCPPSSSHMLSASLHKFAGSAGGACIN